MNTSAEEPSEVNQPHGEDQATSEEAQKDITRWHLVAVGALVVALVASAVAVAASIHARDTNNELSALQESVSQQSLYEAPKDLEKLIATVQASTVVITCKDRYGSGWVIDLGAPAPDATARDKKLDAKYPYEVVTNNHVIKQCHNTPRKVQVTINEKTYGAYLYSWDVKNDLALVAISQKVPALELSAKPQPGWWDMAVGTPYDLVGSVSIGNVMNTDVLEVISTAPLNQGNSGGPLVNSLGQVMGTNSWVMIGKDHPQDWNVAVAVPGLCKEVLQCSESLGWKP